MRNSEGDKEDEHNPTGDGTCNNYLKLLLLVCFFRFGLWWDERMVKR
jgi:hypothetical protein